MRCSSPRFLLAAGPGVALALGVLSCGGVGVSALRAGTGYFGINAYASNGTESAMSNIVQKAIP